MLWGCSTFVGFVHSKLSLNAALQRQYSRFEVAAADISRTDRPDPVDREGLSACVLPAKYGYWLASPEENVAIGIRMLWSCARRDSPSNPAVSLVAATGRCPAADLLH